MYEFMDTKKATIKWLLKDMSISEKKLPPNFTAQAVISKQ